MCFRSLLEIWTIFKMQGLTAKHSARLLIMCFGGLLLIDTPYQTGVEWNICIFLAMFVQNIQKKIRIRLHTFSF